MNSEEKHMINNEIPQTFTVHSFRHKFYIDVSPQQKTPIKITLYMNPSKSIYHVLPHNHQKKISVEVFCLKHTSYKHLTELYKLIQQQINKSTEIVKPFDPDQNIRLRVVHHGKFPTSFIDSDTLQKVKGIESSRVHVTHCDCIVGPIVFQKSTSRLIGNLYVTKMYIRQM